MISALIWIYLIVNIWSLLYIVLNYASNDILPLDLRHIKKYNMVGKILMTSPFWLSIGVFYIVLLISMFMIFCYCLLLK